MGTYVGPVLKQVEEKGTRGDRAGGWGTAEMQTDHPDYHHHR